ncbi:MAG: hypothetical protein ACPKQO_10420 [Nitrososphaeraceae archaeon]
MVKPRPPVWFRLLQILSGIILLILSSLVIVFGFPTFTLETIITILSITLLVIGIERISFVILSSSASNHLTGRKKGTLFTNIGLGILALTFAIISFISPKSVSGIPLVLLSISISVMFNGFGRLLQGILARKQTFWFRITSISLGALSIGAAIFVGNSDTFGIVFPIRILFGILLIHGLAMIIFGSIGKLSIEQMLRK